MDEDALSLLSTDQQASLSDELKAVFSLLPRADQEFFARSFKPDDLPTALARKAEILKRSQANRERLVQIRAEMARSGAEAAAVDAEMNELVGAAAGALGVGAAAAAGIASDNRAHFRGVRPRDLVEPLRAEFEGGKTAVQFGGDYDALTATVSIAASNSFVPAMTINLNEAGDGLDIKVNDLTTRGVLETVKQGSKKLIGAAGGVIGLFRGRVTPGNLIGAVEHGAGLAEIASTLRLKERAWKAMRQAAESREAAFLVEMEEQRQARAALEKAWDNYTHCPTCGVTFGAEDTECRVCGSGRPEPPQSPDPRLEGQG